MPTGAALDASTGRAAPLPTRLSLAWLYQVDIFYGMQLGGLRAFFRIGAMCVCRNLP
jgi:hypothetical protein